MSEFLSIFEELNDTNLFRYKKYDIEEDDLCFEGVVTLAINKVSGIIYNGIGNGMPYVVAYFTNRSDPSKYRGQTKITRNKIVYENVITYIWNNEDEKCVSVEYPGIDQANPSELVIEMYDTDKYKDILMGKLTIAGDQLKQLLKTNEQFEYRLINNEKPAGSISFSLNFKPIRYEGTVPITIKKNTMDILEYSGTLFTTIHKIKGLSSVNSYVEIILKPDETSATTLNLTQPIESSVIELKRTDKNVLKFQVSSEIRSTFNLDVRILEPKKYLDPILISQRNINHTQLKHYIEDSVQPWVPLLNEADKINGRVQLSFQYIVDDEKLSKGRQNDWDDVLNVSYWTIDELKEFMKRNIDDDSKEQSFVEALETLDKKKCQTLSYSQIQIIFIHFHLPITKELKSTILNLFDRNKENLINYLFLVSKTFQLKFIDKIHSELKLVLIDEFNKGKNFRKLFTALGYVEKIPLEVFL